MLAMCGGCCFQGAYVDGCNGVDHLDDNCHFTTSCSSESVCHSYACTVAAVKINHGKDPKNGQERYRSVATVSAEACQELVGTKNGLSNGEIQYAAYGEMGICHT